MKVDLDKESWLDNLTIDSYNYYSAKAEGRFPTQQMLEDGFPTVPSTYNLRWVAFGIGKDKHRTLALKGAHLLSQLLNAKRRGRLHLVNHLFVAFQADKYSLLHADSNSDISLPDLHIDLHPNETYIPPVISKSVLLSPRRTRSKQYRQSASIKVIESTGMLIDSDAQVILF